MLGAEDESRGEPPAGGEYGGWLVRWGRGEGASALWGVHSVAREEAGVRGHGNLGFEKWLVAQRAAVLHSHQLQQQLGFAVGPATRVRGARGLNGTRVGRFFCKGGEDGFGGGWVEKV